MMNSRPNDPSSPSALMTYIGYITGPRAEQPVGVRVVEPPPNTRQYQRGSLYVVVELFGEHPDRAAVSEQLLSELQHTYYAAKGSQSQVMVDALQRGQAVLREVNAHSPRYPLQAGILCAALLNGKLLVVSSGPAFALIHAEGRVHMFPADPSLGSGGFGNSPIELYRQDLEADDAFFLGGGSWLQQVHTRVLAGIVAYTTAETCSDAADELFEQAGHMSLPGLLITLAAQQGPPRRGPGPSGPQAPGPGGSPPRQPPPKRPRLGGLPTALAAPPPARVPPASEPPPQPAAQHDEPLMSATSVPDEVADSTPLASPPPAPLEPAATDLSLDPALVDEAPRVVESTELEMDPGADESPISRSIHEQETELIAPPRPSEADAQGASAAVLAAMEAAAAESAAKRAAARAAEIASPLLPQEPGAEVEPIFPAGEIDEEAPRTTDDREPRPGAAGQVGALLAGGLGAVRGFVTRMLPERLPERPGAAPPTADDVIWPEAEVRAQTRAAAKAEPVRRSARPEPVADGIEEEWPAEEPVFELPKLETPQIAAPARTGGPRARLLLAVAILILVLVPAVVAAIYLGQGSDRLAEAENLTARAELVLLGAQSSLDEGNRVMARERLTEARELLAAAIEIDGVNDRRAELIATIEAELQEVLQVTPIYGLTVPILTFPAEARPRATLVVNEDLFVLDNGRQAVVQYRYDPATRTAPDQTGQVILRQGDSIDGVVVGTPADIAYLPLTPGVVDRPSLLILDRNNNLFRYDPRVAGVSVMNLAGRAEWGALSKVQTYNGLIYLADEGRGQIWRYNPSQADAPGTPWFSDQTQVNLAGLMSMEIDGDIWLLFGNGMILRYRAGEQLPFSPENSIALAEEPSDMVVTWRETANIYLVDAAQERILVYDKGGAYLQQLRAPEEALLRGLAALTVDEVSGVMFILTQTGLFTHPLIQ